MNSHNPPEVRVTPTGATAVTDLPGVDAADTAARETSGLAASRQALARSSTSYCR